MLSNKSKCDVINLHKPRWKRVFVHVFFFCLVCLHVCSYVYPSPALHNIYFIRPWHDIAYLCWKCRWNTSKTKTKQTLTCISGALCFILKIHRNNLSRRPKRQQCKNNWLCFDEFLIRNAYQPNESIYWWYVYVFMCSYRVMECCRESNSRSRRLPTTWDRRKLTTYIEHLRAISTNDERLCPLGPGKNLTFSCLCFLLSFPLDIKH